jgi:hypothetical protein
VELKGLRIAGMLTGEQSTEQARWQALEPLPPDGPAAFTATLPAFSGGHGGQGWTFDSAEKPPWNASCTGQPSHRRSCSSSSFVLLLDFLAVFDSEDEDDDEDDLPDRARAPPTDFFSGIACRDVTPVVLFIRPRYSRHSAASVTLRPGSFTPEPWMR